MPILDKNGDVRRAGLLLGPVLYADQSDAVQWRFSIGLLLDGGPAAPPVDVTASMGLVGPPVRVADFSAEVGACFWRWPVVVDRAVHPSELTYSINPRENAQGEFQKASFGPVHVPARSELPRMGFFSCNGVSSEKLFHAAKDLDALWEDVNRGQNGGGKLHILIGGGDQLYADSLWSTNSALRAFSDLSFRERCEKPVSEEFEIELRREFVTLYVQRWNRPEPAKAFSRIPGVFTWDDHDIVDGWGSHPTELQSSATYKAVGRAAYRAFEAFQLAGVDRGLVVRGDGDGSKHYLQSLRLHDESSFLELLLLDLRSERTLNQVMSDAQWTGLKRRMQARETEMGQGDAAKKPNHLLVVSSIPVVYLRFAAAEQVLGVIPGEQEIEDDLRDHWESPLHRGERARLLMNLLEHSKKGRCRVTLLSGDVHVGARGQVVSTRPEHLQLGEVQAIIDQITSSGIVHPAPGWLQWKAVQAASTQDAELVEHGVTAQLLPIGGLPVLRMRNWLALSFDKAPDPSANNLRRMWLQWRTERGPVQSQVVVDG